MDGAGEKNGDGPENAYSASEGKQSFNAQKCWNQTSSDGVMHVMEGNYSMKDGAFWELWIGARNDGSQTPSGFKTLKGEGKVVLQGPRKVPYASDHKEEGGSWITLARGAKNIRIENFTVTRVGQAVRAEEGANSRLEFRDLHFEDTRQNFTLSGHPECKKRDFCPVKASEISHDVLIQNTSGKRYSKRHVRLSKGIHDVKVLDSHADAEFLDGDFAVGFDVENSSHDILFQGCTSKRNRDTATAYWNGDGFKAENETWNITWKDCSASENADAGFDIKADNAVLENVAAERNNRNIRTWSPVKTMITGAKISNSEHFGGEATEAGLWTQGEVECHSCTLFNNKIQAHAEDGQKLSRIRLYDSTLKFDGKIAGEMVRKEKNSSVEIINSKGFHGA